MATYTELRTLFDNDNLRQRIGVALMIKAQSLLDGATPTADQRRWAQQIFSSPQAEADKMLKYLLAKNNTMTVAQIQAVTDAALSTQIDAVANQFVSAFSGA